MSHRSFVCPFILLLWLIAMAGKVQGGDESANPLHWSSINLKSIPDQQTGEIRAIVDESVVLVSDHTGNASTPYAIISHFSDPDDWHKIDLPGMPEARYASFISDGKQIFVVGGMIEEDISKKVFAICIAPSGRNASIIDYPDLPESIFKPGILVFNGYLYAMGGIRDLMDSAISRHCFRLNLEDPQKAGWEKIPDYPGNPRYNSLIIAQNAGSRQYIFMFGGTTEGGVPIQESYQFDLQSNTWNVLGSPPADFTDGAAHVIGSAHVMLYPKETDSTSYIYHTITDTWVRINSPISGSNILSVSVKKDTIEFLTRLSSSLHLFKGVPKREKDRMTRLDYIMISLYFGILVLIGYYFSGKEKTTRDYFKAGNRVPWLAAGISIIATKLSAVSFVALPAKAFATDLLYVLVPGYYLIAAWFIPKYYIPFLSRIDVTSVYEYLEKRFSTSVRTIGSIAFSVYEIMRMGVLFLVPALVMSVASDINIYYAILIMGIIATLYTYLGGLEAVIWTDVIQTVVMFFGALIVIVFVLNTVEGSFLENWQMLSARQKLRLVNFEFNFTDATLWVLLLSWIGGMKDYMANQTVAQRFISTRNEKSAARSILVSGIGGIAVVWLFLFLGTALFVFYANFPGNLIPTMDQPDALLPWFIVKELPSGVSGILIGAVFSAAMSSLDSAMNSASSLWVTDIYRRFYKKASEKGALRLGKNLIIVFGIFGTSVALLLAGYDIQSLIDQFFAFLGLFGSGLGGLFVLGIFTVRANHIGAISGFVGSGIVQFLLQRYGDINVFLYLFTGMASCVILGYLVSVLFPSGNKDLQNLTIHTYQNE